MISFIDYMLAMIALLFLSIGAGYLASMLIKHRKNAKEGVD